MDVYYVIKEPLVTEKATRDAQAKTDASRYFFRVDPDATKIDIRRAVETLFKVKVADVNTVTVHGKSKLNPRNRRMIREGNWKKAIVTLKKGNKIEIFEGV